MAEAARSPAVWMDRLVSLVLAGSVVGVAVASAPHLRRVFGESDGVSVVEPPRPIAPPKTKAKNAAPRDDRPELVLPDEDPRLEELDRILEQLSPPIASDDSSDRRATTEKPKRGRADTELMLRKEPKLGSTVTAWIAAGTELLVLGEKNDFVFVMRMNGGADHGWVPKAAVTTR